MANYKVIDMKTWAGKDVYEHFLSVKNPFVGGTSEVDIKNLVKLAKEKRTTVNTLVMYTIGRAVNSISQFRLRMLDGKLVEFDNSCLNIPVTARGREGYFNFCNIDFDFDLDKFIQNVKTATLEAKKRKGLFPFEKREDAVYISHANGYYTALNNPTNGKYDFYPRINWGEPKEGIALSSNEAILIPITIEAHHSIISGYHLEKFHKIFQKTCDNDLKPKK